MAHPLHIGAAIDGAGSHPAAHRSTPAAPNELFTAAHYAHSARLAEHARLDFVTLDDSFAAPGRPGVPGRPDALLTLAALAPVTSGLGLVPTVTTTHTEPFHVSKGIASLDHASRGRAGWLVEVSDTEDDARLVGRRPVAPAEELWNEAGSVVDAASALWDSWEDGAEIRDVESGRFIDRDRLHYVDHEYVPAPGRSGRETRNERAGWTVRGPSITPRPPQGHPVVFVRADTDHQLRTAARYADAVLIRARTPERAAQRRAEVHRAVRGAGRDPGQVRVLADLGIVLDRDRRTAEERNARLDALVPWAGAPEAVAASGGEPPGATFPASAKPAATFAGTPRDLAREIEAWSEAVDGLTLRPAVLPVDLERFAVDTVPLLREAGLLRTGHTADTLRGNLGLPRPDNRYTGTPAAAADPGTSEAAATPGTSEAPVDASEPTPAREGVPR